MENIWFILVLLQSAFHSGVLSESQRDFMVNNGTEAVHPPTTLKPRQTNASSYKTVPAEVTTKKMEPVETTKATVVPVTTMKKPVRLRNEPCIARPTLINTDDKQYKYVPLVISLHRCGGACGHFPPSVKYCAVGTDQKIPVKLFDRNRMRYEVVQMSNHTSCQCKCTKDCSVCDPETQVFDQGTCQCKCKKDAKEHTCPRNFVWDSTTCGCVCSPTCNYKQDVNYTSCSCTCQKRYYKRCNRKRKIINEDNCKCMLPPDTGRSSGCDPLPRKWVALIAVVSSIALLVIAFDAILLGKKTGFFHAIVSWFSSRVQQRTHQRVANPTT